MIINNTQWLLTSHPQPKTRRENRFSKAGRNNELNHSFLPSSTHILTCDKKRKEKKRRRTPAVINLFADFRVKTLGR